MFSSVAGRLPCHCAEISPWTSTWQKHPFSLVDPGLSHSYCHSSAGTVCTAGGFFKHNPVGGSVVNGMTLVDASSCTERLCIDFFFYIYNVDNKMT